MSKYASSLSANHYDKLKNIAKHLCTTQDWGIVFKQSAPRTELPISTAESIPIDDKLPAYPGTSKSNKLVGYVDAAYGREDLRPDMPLLILVGPLCTDPKHSPLLP